MSSSLDRLKAVFHRKRHIGGGGKRRLWNHLSERTQAVQGGGPPSNAEIVTYLIKSGLDYGGQLNFAFQTIGHGGLFGARIDVLRMALTAVGLPFLPLTGALRPELSAKAARHRLLLVEHQGMHPSGYT